MILQDCAIMGLWFLFLLNGSQGTREEMERGGKRSSSLALLEPRGVPSAIDDDR